MSASLASNGLVALTFGGLVSPVLSAAASRPKVSHSAPSAKPPMEKTMRMREFMETSDEKPEEGRVHLTLFASPNNRSRRALVWQPMHDSTLPAEVTVLPSGVTVP